MSPSPGTKLGPYTLMAALGSGGMGEVYTALDTRLDRLVALKVLPSHLATDPTARARFDREARAIAGLNHPNVCALFDVGHDQGHDFLVMELLEGVTLQERLEQGPIDISSLVTYGIALADALDAAHGNGLIHRDLKPANIFITARDVPKILDFGLAKTLEAADDATRQSDGLVTTVGSTIGTLAYMSPEQLRGETLDARTDLFSLGLVLYEMATGQRAFTGPTSAVISAGILGQPAAPPRTLRPELPSRLEDTILKAIEKDKALRSQTASELRADLMRIKREQSDVVRSAVAGNDTAAAIASSAPVAIEPVRASSSSRGRAFAGAAIVLLALAGTGAYWWTHRASAPPAIVSGEKRGEPILTPPPPEPPPPVPASSSPPVGIPAQTPAQTTKPAPPPSAASAPSRSASPAATSNTLAGTQPPAVTTPPPSAAEPPATARGNAGRSGTGVAGRGRAGRGPLGPAANNVIATLQGLPPQNYHIVFAAGSDQARAFALQLQEILNAGGWKSSGVQPTQNATPGVLGIGVPHQSPGVNVVRNWATRSGYNPDYRVLPFLKEINIVVGPPK